MKTFTVRVRSRKATAFDAVYAGAAWTRTNTQNFRIQFVVT